MDDPLKQTELEHWQVYIILTETGKLYTGITKDLNRRFDEHLAHKGRGARFFSFSRPQKILFSESHPNRSEASKREAFIKSLSRSQKLTLIAEQPKAP
ncbi:MAG: hypothetical protein K0S07_332 [Chlamydiales bacterium]|jgi:putative endonuclease|nr:hypothetical protein [Chlamydiales bacterium]